MFLILSESSSISTSDSGAISDLEGAFKLDLTLKVEFCCTNVGFGTFNFSGGLGLAGQGCTAAFTWY